MKFKSLDWNYKRDGTFTLTIKIVKNSQELHQARRYETIDTIWDDLKILNHSAIHVEFKREK